MAVNRKKLLRNKKRRNVTTHIVSHVQQIRFYKIRLHYASISDTYMCELFCTINGDKLSIKGVINVIALVDGLVKIDAPMALKEPQYNATTIALVKKDAPTFYQLVQDFIYTTADALDAGVKRPADIHIQSQYGLIDQELTTVQ